MMVEEKIKDNIERIVWRATMRDCSIGSMIRGQGKFKDSVEDIIAEIQRMTTDDLWGLLDDDELALWDLLDDDDD